MKVKAILDKQFRPMALVCREMREATEKDGQDIVIGIERNNGYVSAYKTRIYRDGTGHDELNFDFIERMVKSLLWVRGGYKIIIAGSPVVGNKIKEAYAKGGLRDFDNGFMSRVYERPFEVVVTTLENAPVTKESASPIGRHLDGCRIGFDAGGSDRKVSAVIDGEAVYSEEVVWFPKTNSDPKYHYDGILQAMKTAASHMPRVDGIGVSSAGVYIDNRIMIASLFLKVSDEDFEKHVKNMYLDVAKEIGENIPVEVANDGDVTALAGAMDLDDDSVLGVAMGTSEAGGYVDEQGNITGSGDVTLEHLLASSSAEAEVTGSGTFKINGGKAREAAYNITGSGDIHAAGLEASRVNTHISGSGNIECHAVDFLKVRVSGSGNVGYKGDPELDVPNRHHHRL